MPCPHSFAYYYVLGGIVLLPFFLSFLSCEFPTAEQAAVEQQNFQTTEFRYINMTHGAASHILRVTFATYSLTLQTRVDSTITLPPVPRLGVTAFSSPKADSGRVMILDSFGQILFSPRPYLFTDRNARYTFIGLPAPPSSKAVLDTVLVLRSLPSQLDNNTVSVRIVNCNSDSSVVYTVALGCPSGMPLTSNLAFRKVSAISTLNLPSGILNLAITEQRLGSTSSPAARTFRITLRTLVPKNIYTLLIYNDNTGTPALLGINERTTEQLISVSSSNPQTFIRVANFSSTVLNGVFYQSRGIPSASISTNIPPLTLTSYQSLVACESVGNDTLVVKRSSSSIPIQHISTALEVNGSQTVVVDDSIAVVVPAHTPNVSANTVVVRFINLCSDSVLVMRGTTTQQPSYIIAPKLLRGSVSAPFAMPVADVLHPFLVFRADNSGRLLQHSVSTLPASIARTSSYLAVLRNEGITLIPDVSQESTPPSTQLSPSPKGAVVQVLHAFSDATLATVQLAIGTVLRTNIGYGAPILTVLPANARLNITMGRASLTPHLEESVRYVVIGSGIGTLQQLTLERSLWTSLQRELIPSPMQGIIRYYNATINAPRLRVRADVESGFHLRTPIERNQFSTPDRFFSNQTRTLTFLQNETPIFRANNLTFLLGKGYTVVLTNISANTSDSSYNALVLQEY
ncbi:MAG: hypothetical protein RML40_00970 [Bacteroidota bacterium]|nr:TASOR family protein [Candidatus Kapabacteria bacterium]MDW8219079.1 hypothetical protein [Bacteroidota bacterium]